VPSRNRSTVNRQCARLKPFPQLTFCVPDFRYETLLYMIALGRVVLIGVDHLNGSRSGGLLLNLLCSLERQSWKRGCRLSLPSSFTLGYQILVEFRATHSRSASIEK
jgi:hypothetical protein